MSAQKEWSGVTTPEQARQHIERLVERFARNLDVYTRTDYKETQVRVEFIDRFFEALGWDMRNVPGYAEQYKDVAHEDAIKVSGATRAPDRCSQVGGVHFFLESATLASAAVPATRSCTSGKSRPLIGRLTRWCMSGMGRPKKRSLSWRGGIAERAD